MKLGELIKKRRNELNMTQEELAKKINVSRSAISNWEIGRNYPDIQLIILLSDELDLSLDHLLKGEEHVVKQISNDTKSRKKMSKKIKLLYISILIISAIIYFYKTNEYLDISNTDQILSITKSDQTLDIETDLPFYRSLETYFMNTSTKENTLEIVLSSKIDLTMKNNNHLKIPLLHTKHEYNQIDVLDDGKVIKTFNLK